MDAFAVYRDIQARTNGQFMVGVVGPVRTGKSTFIRRFMEVLAGSGTLITTVEPKFIPREAVEVSLGDEVTVRLRLIDCVGFLVPQATGNVENEKERMVKTPWFEQEIPFRQAAKIGTEKVISEHSNSERKLYFRRRADGAGAEKTGKAVSDPGEFAEAL